MNLVAYSLVWALCVHVVAVVECSCVCTRMRAHAYAYVAVHACLLKKSCSMKDMLCPSLFPG